MAKTRKKKSNTPRHKRLKRQSRFQAAVHWLPKYQGKNLVHGYSRHFAVDPLCAIKELQMLGIEIDPNYIAQIHATQTQKQLQRVRRKQREMEEANERENSEYGKLFEFDEHFAFIAGFTEGGAAYGVTWDDWEEEVEEAIQSLQSNHLVPP